MNRQHVYGGIALVALIFAFIVHDRYQQQAYLELSTPYTICEIDEPVLIDLLNSKAMDRLKHINQYGIEQFVHVKPLRYTRHKHSVGVFALLRRYGASLKEQIAGLLHDASHTAFSHVGDYVYPEEGRGDAYQDSIHEQYLRESDLSEILDQHGYSVEEIKHKGNGFNCLESEYPDICADRLEYNLHGALLEGQLTEQDIENILGHLYFEDGQWYLDDPGFAEIFARAALYLTENHWATDWNGVLVRMFADALRYALDTGTISRQQLHFGTDQEVWDTLVSSNNQALQQKLADVQHYTERYEQGTVADHNLSFDNKFRGIDPLVTHGGRLVRLTTLSPAYAEEFERVRLKLSQPHYIKYKAASQQ